MFEIYYCSSSNAANSPVVSNLTPQNKDKNKPEDISNNINNASYNPITIIPPKKAIFVARISSDNTEDDVSYYIKSKLNQECEIQIKKFTYTQKRSKASFQIIVPENVFNLIIDPSFWPPNAILHEFIYKEKPRSDVVYLPHHTKPSISAPKN